MDRAGWVRKGPELVAGGVAAIAVAFAALLVVGASLRAAGLVAAALALPLAVVAAGGWRRARERAARAEASAAQASEERRADRERMERHARRVETAQRQESELFRRLRQSLQAEREWNRELRSQVQRLHAGRGMLDEGEDDVAALILRAAIELVEAEKGLLVSRTDGDADGDLDVVLARGFERDPQHSAVAQRFARAVLARDEIIREDTPRQPGATDSAPADAEIHSLVAIPVYLRDRFHGVIVCANRPGGFEAVDDDLLLALGDHAGAALHYGRLQHELGDAHRSAVRVLAETVSAQDPVLHRETCELAVHAALLAQDLGLDRRERDLLICATLLRAVGYLALPDRPRLRPGLLTPDERALIELHPRLGFNVLAQAPALHDAGVAVLYHHERYDGTGYPAGLSGTDIPLAARVLAALEAYGAMTHERPYRTPLPPEQACQELVACSGTQFDPEITARLVEQIRRNPRVAREDVSAAVLDALPLDLEADGAGASLVAAAVDGSTLLGNQRALQQDIGVAAHHETPFGVVAIELCDIPQVNEEAGFPAGDRLIAQAARSTRRAAARLGGTAYRLSGRRFAILVPARDGGPLTGTVQEVQSEFLPGPSIRVAMASSLPGESGSAVLDRARAALRAGDEPQSGQPA
jgi:HD-GYP domain-containing protein (c-di-GMP phosphodiesterase class II)